MSVSVTRMKMFVGGEWVDSADGGTMEVLNPSTGETIGSGGGRREHGCRRYPMPVPLAPLPYAIDALEPVISAEALSIRHRRQ